MPEWDRAGEENSQHEIVGNLLWSTRDLTLEQPFPAWYYQSSTERGWQNDATVR